MDTEPMERLKRGVVRVPQSSVKLARHTAGKTFRATLGAVVVTEQESTRLVRTLVRRGPKERVHWVLPFGYHSERDFEEHIEDYLRYLMQLRRMPTLTEVRQLEETICRLMAALDQVLEEKNRVKAEHAGEVPTEWIEEMVAMLGRKPQPTDAVPLPPAAISAPPPRPATADHATADPRATPAEEQVAAPPKPAPRMKEPFPGYRGLSATQILTQIYAMTPQELRKVQQYEERHHKRVTILRAVEMQLADAEGAGKL